MLLRALISDIRSQLRQNSDDTILTDRHIASECSTVAINLIRRDLLSKKITDHTGILAEIPCIKMVEADLQECISIPHNCKISRSRCKIEIPAIGLTSVYSIDLSTRFKEVSPARYENALKLRISQKNFFLIINQYIYVTDPEIKMIRVICPSVTDIILPPECTCIQNNCKNPFDNEFKCPDFLIENIKEAVLTKFSKYFKASHQDISTNEFDESR